MIHYLVGDVGHLFVIISFVSSLASSIIYLRAKRSPFPDEQKAWLLNGRTAFAIHTASVVGVVISLFIIIERHYFEYHYAFSHSSRSLAPEYMIACFWEG